GFHHIGITAPASVVAAWWPADWSGGVFLRRRQPGTYDPPTDESSRTV
ncbi:MAG: hypothetical protein HC893_10095, partial [Chloroflexaceae bacterium]|nr:hypothetical protein [Chloroflexaceae bacterium]